MAPNAVMDYLPNILKGSKKEPRAGYPFFETKADPTADFNLEDVKHGWNSLKEEYSYEVTDIDGTIPAGLQGTLFRNGAGMLDVFGQQVANPIDGDGMITAIGFANGRAYFRNRYVRTEGYVKEQKAGVGVLHRGVFGTKRSSKLAPSWMYHVMDMKFKNTANTCVVYHEGKLLALWEGGLPYALDPVTLDTIGEEDFGVLNRTKPFAAHTKQDPLTGNFIGIALDAQGPKTTVSAYEWTKGWKLLSVRSWQLPDYGYFHDFAITPHHYVFYQNSELQGVGKLVDVLRWLAGMGSPGEDWKFDPKAPARVWLMDRPAPGGPVSGVQPPPAQAFELGPSIAWHMGNAFEEEDPDEPTRRTVVLDCLRHPSADFKWAIETVNCISSMARYARIRVSAAIHPPPLTHGAAAETDQPDASGPPPAPNGAAASSAAEETDARKAGTSGASAAKGAMTGVPVGPVGAVAPMGTAGSVEEVEERSAELAVVNPTYTGLKYRYAYSVAAKEIGQNSPFQCIAKYDMGTGPDSPPRLAWNWFAGPRKFVGEPIFAPASASKDADEDEGWVLTLVFDGETSKTNVVILDAKTATAVCTLHLTHHVPYGFHGSFCPEVIPTEV